jgi:glycosyltransferase involved in cell wall biosynthesis
VGRRLARRYRRPLVFTYHTRYEKYAHYVPLRRELVERLAVRLSTRFAARADAVIAPSTVIRDELRRRGVTTPITVVPTGVDIERFRPGDRVPARRALGLPERGPLLLYVGRLDREKSVDRLLVAVERVGSTLPESRFVLVGQGTEAERLRRLAASTAMASRIRFAGVKPHHTLARYYQAADLFLFASQTET